MAAEELTPMKDGPAFTGTANHDTREMGIDDLPRNRQA
jgi:hypothetical protein